MKKTLVVLGIIMVLIITGITTVQAATATATIKSSANTVKPGDTFTVTLSATCDVGLNGIIGEEEFQGFGFNYDTEKLELVSREAKTMTDANDGKNTIGLAYLGTSTITTGDVYTWTFKVKSGATGTANFSTTPMEIVGLDNSKTSISAQNVGVSISGDSNQNGNTTPSNTNPNANKTPGTSTTAKSGTSTDSTTAKTKIPAAGRAAIGGAIVIAVIGAIVAFRKTHNIEI